MHSRTAKNLRILLLVELSGAILYLAYGNVCHRTILQDRKLVLKVGLAEMRKAIDAYTVDKKRPPESLQALIDEKYLAVIPVDPVTRKTDWIPHYVSHMARVGPTVGIDDVRTASLRTSSEGTAYSEW